MDTLVSEDLTQQPAEEAASREAAVGAESSATEGEFLSLMRS